jgi:hypothetical protein
MRVCIVFAVFTIFYSPKDEPVYNASEPVTESVLANGNWQSLCSADGWPIPTLKWVYNSIELYNDDSMQNPSYNLISYHHHSKAISHLYVNNFTSNLQGTYACLLNDKIVLKNITLVLNAVAESGMRLDGT